MIFFLFNNSVDLQVELVYDLSSDSIDSHHTVELLKCGVRIALLSKINSSIRNFILFSVESCLGP